MELKGKTVLITGAAKRIGRELALGFANKGSHILVHYRNSQKEAEELVGEIRAKGVKSHSYCADLCSVDELRAMTQAISRDDATVDILVNNASCFYPTPMQTTTDAQWNEFLAIHVKTPFFLSQQLGSSMKRQGRGRIINMADSAGLRPQKNYLPYSTSKAALIALTRSLAKELAPEVLVNAVCPGPILPPPGTDEVEQDKIAQKTLLKRWGTPADVVRQVIFLAEQDYATGGVYLVDGGESLPS